MSKLKGPLSVPSAPSTTEDEADAQRSGIDVFVPAVQQTKKSGQVINAGSWHKCNISFEMWTL